MCEGVKDSESGESTDWEDKVEQEKASQRQRDWDEVDREVGGLIPETRWGILKGAISYT